jgi:capsular polysaccharide export protein
MRCLGPLERKRVLLLQGPNGPFFARLAKVLESEGAIVTKVNFNGGDCLFFPHASHVFREPMSAWPAYCERLFEEERFDWVLLFGDCRSIHRAAIEIAKRRGVCVGVFEEGYIRPNFITFELGGVNAYSSVPKEPWFFLALPPGPIPAVPIPENAFWFSVLWSALYHGAASALRPWFRQYEHHRTLSVTEAVPWVRGAFRKLRYRWSEAGTHERLTTAWSGDYFLVPLQVHNDAQVTVHSDYPSVAAFIVEVVGSFAAHAPAETLLVIKHHPLDRGYNDYSTLIAAEARRLGIPERVVYVHDQHLPSLIEHARGVIVINSTAGLQALDHRAPVKVCGRAAYDIEGLTFSGALEDFWGAAEKFTLDEELLAAFKRYLVVRTQLGGSLYRPLPSGALLQELGQELGPSAARVAPHQFPNTPDVVPLPTMSSAAE